MHDSSMEAKRHIVVRWCLELRDCDVEVNPGVDSLARDGPCIRKARKLLYLACEIIGAITGLYGADSTLCS